MADRLTGKVAIVTAGVTGVGAAICRLFIEEGAAVLVTDSQEEITDTPLREAMEHASQRAAFCRIDPSEEGSFEAACAKAVALWGKVSVAVAHSGAIADTPFVQAQQGDWDSAMHEQVRPAFLLAKYAMPRMTEAGGGAFIAVLPALERASGSRQAIASACRGALRSFARSAAVEQVKAGIRVNLVLPGVIDIEGRSGANASSGNLVGAPQDIAWGCVFLASDEARFVSGAELEIGGGER